jgi:beta-lactamase class A
MLSRIARIGREAGIEHLAVAGYDYESHTSWNLAGDDWFHAASTIKVAVMVAVFAAIEEGCFTWTSPVHIRNRFFGAADRKSYRISPERDANAELHTAIGKMRTVEELVVPMIVTSSNLATNLLVDLVGIAKARRALHDLGLQGIELARGVEDEVAFEAGLNNQVTARGLVELFRLLHEGHAASPRASRKMLDILEQQQFRSGIPAGLPERSRAAARLAHKTGEISTVAHDAGLVTLESRAPWALAILTRWEPNKAVAIRQQTIARISRVIHDELVSPSSSDMEPVQ